MSLLVERRTERIDLGDGEWVDILAELPVKEACLVGEALGKPLTTGTLEVLQLVITAWSDDVPVNPENIAQLKPKVSRAILDRVRELNVAPDPKVSSLPLISTSRAERRRAHTKTS